MENKKESSMFLKIQSKHRQVILSKFPKSFGAGNFVVFYIFFEIFGLFQT